VVVELPSSAAELSTPAAESTELPDLIWIWIWKVIGKLPEGISRRWKTPTLSSQPSKWLAVSLSGLRRSLWLIAGVSGRVCLHSFLHGKMNFDYYFTNEY